MAKVDSMWGFHIEDETLTYRIPDNAMGIQKHEGDDMWRGFMLIDGVSRLSKPYKTERAVLNWLNREQRRMVAGGR